MERVHFFRFNPIALKCLKSLVPINSNAGDIEGHLFGSRASDRLHFMSYWKDFKKFHLE